MIEFKCAMSHANLVALNSRNAKIIFWNEICIVYLSETKIV